MMKTVVHLCTAWRVHLIPGKEVYSEIVKDFKHIYIYVGAKEEDKPMYNERVSKYDNSRCMFLDKLEEVYGLDKEIKNSMLLTHGFTFKDSFMLKLHGFKNVHWICWGAGAEANTSLKKKLLFPIKRFMLKTLDGAVALMEPDANALIKNYGMKRVETIPYCSTTKVVCDKEYLKATTINNRVLLGNNSNTIPYHGEALDKLKKFAGKIKVDCLLNYSLVKNDEYYALVKKGKEYFGDDFNTIENFMTQEEYTEFIKQYDVYICNRPTQTGLGAIYRCMRLGKKLFLIGRNYDWIQSLGGQVHNMSELDTISFEDFVEPLSLEVKTKNFDTIIDLISKVENAPKWEQYIRKYS